MTEEEKKFIVATAPALAAGMLANSTINPLSSPIQTSIRNSAYTQAWNLLNLLKQNGVFPTQVE